MESAFQFTNPVLTGIEFLLNSGFSNQDNEEIQIKMNIAVNISKADNNEAEVSLICEIGEKSEKSPFWIKAEEKAKFRWEDEIDEELADKLLNQNAPSLLISYLRPIVGQVTMASPYGAYNIPFINFTKK